MASEVSALLAKLNLSQHAPIFEEEEINDVSLLVSMGPEMLAENLEELGLDAASVSVISAALFPGAEEEDDGGLELEDNPTETPPVPSGAPPPPAAASRPGPLPAATGAPVDALPNDLTQEEIDAAEAEAQWLLNPLSMLDLSDTKDVLVKRMSEGNLYQKQGQFANARAVYTRALNMEAPNKRMNAALYYNRSACQRQLGQLKLSLIDATKAYELDPSMIKAYWRAGDVAIILDEHAEAREAIEAGLKVAPRNQPLLQLKLQVQRF